MLESRMLARPSIPGATPMSVERTREVMNRYWDSNHTDLSVMADDVVFTHMSTGDEHRGPAAVQRMLQYMYHTAFNAHAETRNRIYDESHAVIEGEFVGTHIGEFAGIAATGRSVRVPLCVIYDLSGGKITQGRVYLDPGMLARQLGAGTEAEAVATALPPGAR